MNANVIQLPSQSTVAALTVAAAGGSVSDIAQAKAAFSEPTQPAPVSPDIKPSPVEASNLPIVLTKPMLQGIVWPKGATHIRIEAPKGKFAVSSRKAVTYSLVGFEMVSFQFGAEIKNNGKVGFAALAVQPTVFSMVGPAVAAAAKPAKVEAKKSSKPVAETPMTKRSSKKGSSVSEPTSKPASEKPDKSKNKPSEPKAHVPSKREIITDKLLKGIAPASIADQVNSLFPEQKKETAESIVANYSGYARFFFERFQIAGLIGKDAKIGFHSSITD